MASPSQKIAISLTGSIKLTKHNPTSFLPTLLPESPPECMAPYTPTVYPLPVC